MTETRGEEFAPSLFKYQRLPTRQIRVGGVTMGGDAPVRIQSMTTTDTNDVASSAAQSIRIVEAGGEIVRLTTQGEREARSIGEVRAEMDRQGCRAPLVADVHFNPKAAVTAAGLVEGVRINPGNFTGEAKRFNADADTMSDEEWHALIVEKLRPLIATCRDHKTAVRIGVNHGSLSDRIMAKHGDTPQGMVASCLEYVVAMEELDFRDIVISIKSSNTRVMVETVRLLVAALRRRGTAYPLHLGVTEAGSDAEGRIKSAAGIGALLNDGLGDTVRVSLTEAPEKEIPVALALVNHCSRLALAPAVRQVETSGYSPYAYARRKTVETMGIGGSNAPVVMTAGSGGAADWTVTPRDGEASREGGSAPMVSLSEYARRTDATPCFVCMSLDELCGAPDSQTAALARNAGAIVMGQCRTGNYQAEIRALALELTNRGINSPLVCRHTSHTADVESFQLEISADLGGLLIDGLIDGVYVDNAIISPTVATETALTLLQATRARFSRTEFISCPGCGRTLYDIQETSGRIKSQFGHLRGLKIGIMGCIVNGIGEMADADYGYVGAGRGKISLYRGKELVRRSLEQGEALEALRQLIADDGRWVDAQKEP